MGSTGANRGSANRNALREDVEAYTNNPLVAARWSAAYTEEVRQAALEQIRENSETRRIVEEANRQNAAGTRNWEPTEGQRLTSVSYEQAENELFNAPIGTVITMDNHNTGDYVGEYTRTESGWQGSQRYRSNRVRPATVTTARGFAMQVVGNDIRVLTVGRRQR